MMKDWRGVEINVGDLVVYPGRRSSRIWMTEAEVVSLHSFIELRWNWQTQKEEPKETGYVRVRRLRDSWETVAPKEVNVGPRLLTVVRTAQEIKRARSSPRYVQVSSTGLTDVE